MGVVAAVGEQVSGLVVGDRVASPFTSCCGDCFYCRKGATCRCCHAHAHLFGWVSQGEEQLPAEHRRGLQGSQAQYVRVPLAASTLMKLPDDVSDEAGLLLGDILSTAFFCAERGGVGAGDTVAVMGCGPVGLLTVMAAKHLGAETVFAIDAVPERLALAEQLGARPLRLKTVAAADDSAGTGPLTQDAIIGAIHDATDGRGADVVLEAVGANSALQLAYDIVRPMGTISSVGVNTSPAFPFSPTQAYDKNITFRCGRCPARAVMERLLPLVRQGVLPLERIFTHRMPLSRGTEAYDIFARRLDGAVKIVLDPWA